MTSTTDAQTCPGRARPPAPADHEHANEDEDEDAVEHADGHGRGVWASYRSGARSAAIWALGLTGHTM